MNSIDIATQVHDLLTPGEAPDPNAAFWDLTVGGTLINTGDENHKVHLITSERVSELADALQSESWENLERIAENNYDMMPGWHKDLRPEFERIREFMANASREGSAVLRVSSSDAFWYR